MLTAKAAALCLTLAALAACGASPEKPLTAEEKNRALREHAESEQMGSDSTPQDVGRCSSSTGATRLHGRQTGHRGVEGFDARACPPTR
jgi:hypothetical protein